MSKHGLMSRFAGGLGDKGEGTLPDTEVNDLPEGEPQRQPPPKSTSLSNVYRGLKKKATPSRDDSVKSSRAPSRLALKAFASGASGSPTPSPDTPLPDSAPPHPNAESVQHARNLSLQNSLEKPLPEPPPEPESDLDPTLESDAEFSDNDVTPLAYGLPTEPLRPKDSVSSIVDEYRQYPDNNVSPKDTSVPAPNQHHMYGGGVDMSGSQSSVASSARPDGGEAPRETLTPRNGSQAMGPPPPTISTTRAPAAGQAVGTTAPSSSSTHLSGLMCNVHRTTGREPHPLVGATTTILGDKLYVFGGRILSRSRPAPLISDLYELDLVRRHWTKVEATGDIPPPRYFHSMCALGDTKMVCYGGMSPHLSQPSQANPEAQPEVAVMSDIHIYDAPTKKWSYVATQDAPQGRYAHCACVLPSSATFSSHKAPLSALQHNPSNGNPNEGRIGINIDGTGGAEMVVVGGQDGANHYIGQISVFNLRSLKWTTTQPLNKDCGAYRSVVASLSPSVNAQVGKAHTNGTRPEKEAGISQEAREPGSSMLIYSNYNFLDVKLELQIRGPDGSLAEKAMSGSHTPPGLRFPNGGVIDHYFVVSGTYLTSSKQEYALWALDLRDLTWSRIDAGGSVFSQGSWNRGVLWNRRNTFVILGNRKRSLVDDYNHRRINFSNMCTVELEAFGLYDNPRRISPMSGFVSTSSPYATPGLSLARKAGWTGGGRSLTRAAEELGEKALGLRELSDMNILCIGGERIPINSRMVGRRWGPYFVQLLREGAATQDGSDAATLRTVTSGAGNNRYSAMTITQNNNQSAASLRPPGTAGASGAGGNSDVVNINAAPTPASLPPNSRPRCLYLPHTYLTVQALLRFLYTSSLPPNSSPLCTPQILCSLLQIAAPYKIDGLLEAVVERLHVALESRNAAAVFNATAMAAGGGRGIDGTLNPNFFIPAEDSLTTGVNGRSTSVSQSSDGPAGAMDGLRINTSVPGARPSTDELSATTSVSGSEWSSELGDSERSASREVWNGDLSSVIGLQKRGLRGLMQGRRLRTTADKSREGDGPRSGGGGDRVMERQMAVDRADRMGSRVGLGIAGS